MTSILSSNNNKNDSMSAKIEPSLSDKFMHKFFKQKNKITVRTWVTASGIETAVEEKDVKLGTLDVELGSGKYTIDYTAVQNIFGELVYNTTHRVANGALRFSSQSKKDVDAKLRKSMSARDNLTAIWSRWQLPFIACIIAMVVAIIAISMLAIFLAQLQTANNCLATENCMVGKIAQLRANQPKPETNGAIPQ